MLELAPFLEVTGEISAFNVRSALDASSAWSFAKLSFENFTFPFDSVCRVYLVFRKRTQHGDRVRVPDLYMSITSRAFMSPLSSAGMSGYHSVRSAAFSANSVEFPNVVVGSTEGSRPRAI